MYLVGYPISSLHPPSHLHSSLSHHSENGEEVRRAPTSFPKKRMPVHSHLVILSRHLSHPSRNSLRILDIVLASPRLRLIPRPFWPIPLLRGGYSTPVAAMGSLQAGSWVSRTSVDEEDDMKSYPAEGDERSGSG
jgi:hypothetical protein